jgi:hypothetical protein
VSFQALGDALAAAASGMAAAAASSDASDAASASTGATPPPLPPHSHKRRAWKSEDKDDGAGERDGMGDDGGDGGEEGPSAKKRAKAIGKPRIAYYPRVMARIQSLGTKPLEQSLSLLRQLKYAENVIFAGRDPYASGGAPSSSPSPSPSPASTPSPPRRPLPPAGVPAGGGADPDLLAHADVETILLDLL